MNFYRLNPRQDYSGYWPEEIVGEIAEFRISANSRQREVRVTEYFGDPPREPAKHGAFHKSAYGYFVRKDALLLVSDAAHGKLLTSPTVVVGRESETFYQFWVTNYVDCLDISNTVTSPTASPQSGKIGVIRRPVFDESRWDGSDLFVIPQDPSYSYFVSERFIERWRAAKFKGAMFSRYAMDLNAIRC